MGQFDQTLQAKRAQVQAQKAQSAANVIQAKQHFQVSDALLDVKPSDDLANIFGAMGTARNEMNTESPVVKTEGPVSVHEDGSYSVVTEDGRTLTGLNELDAKEIGAYSNEYNRAQRADASRTYLGTRASAFSQTVVDIGVQGASAFTGDTTLEGKVEVYNFQDKQRGKHAKGSISPEDITKFREMGDRTELSSDEQAFRETTKYKKIAELAKEARTNKSQFDAIHEFGKDVKSNFAVNRADQVAAHEAFKVIAKNDGNLAAAWRAVTQDLGSFVEQGVDSIPYMIAFTAGGPITQSVLLATLATGKGNQAVEEFRTKNKRAPSQEELGRIKLWAAVATVAEKFGDMAVTKAIPITKLKWAQGVMDKVNKSMPSSIANLAIVRPSIVLAGEGASGAITEVSEQIAQSGKITDVGEIAFAATAEALGTIGGAPTMVAANVALGTAKRILSPSNSAQADTDSLNTALTDLQTRLDSDEPISVGETPEGDALQERLAEVAAVIAVTDGADDAANAEHAAITAQLAEPASGDASAQVKADLEKQVEELTSVIAAQEAGTTTDSPTTTAADIANNVETDTSDITPEDFATEIARISSDDTPLQERVEAFVALKSRGMTTEQKKEREALADVLTKAAEDFGNTSESAPSMKPTKKGSYGITDDGTLETDEGYDRTKLDNVISDKDSSEADKVHAGAQIGAQDTRARILARNNGTMAGVATDVREGTNDRWLGFKTYVDQINEINQRIKSAVSEVEGSTIFQEVKSTLSKMKTHRDNMANKTAALKKAMDASVKDGTPRYVRGNKGAGYNFKTNRVMEYIDPITAQEAELGRDLTTDERIKANEELAAAYKNRKTSGEYIYRLDANDAASQILIDTVTDEATYGDYMVTAAETHSQTSYAKTAGLNARDKAKLEKQIDDINNEAPIVEDTDKASDEEIDDALDNLDTPGETNNDSANETSTNETSSTNDSDNTTEEGDSLGENPPPADGPETTTVQEPVEDVSEKPTTEEAGTVTLATLTPEDIFSQSELGNLENILGISEEDIQDYIDNPEKLGRQIGDLDQIDLREDGAAAQAELDAEIAALDKIWAKMRSVMTAAETKQFVPDQKSFEERFDENQQDDLAAEQDVLEEEVYDPSILTTEERIVEAMNNDTALADSPNTSSETIKEYNALKKELDELNQIIRCLKT